jgi:hypothetical protein
MEVNNMFGEIILVSGVVLFSSIVEKILEEMGKESTATYVGLATKCGLGIYAIKQINEVVKEAVKDFM